MLRTRRLGGDPQLQKASANAPALGRGAKGSGVAELQDLLVDLGFALPISMKKAGPDGIFGAETEAAVKKFQAQSGLKADGLVGTNTLARLEQLIAKFPALEAPSAAGEIAVVAFDENAPSDRKHTLYL